MTCNASIQTFNSCSAKSRSVNSWALLNRSMKHRFYPHPSPLPKEREQDSNSLLLGEEGRRRSQVLQVVRSTILSKTLIAPSETPIGLHKTRLASSETPIALSKMPIAPSKTPIALSETPIALSVIVPSLSHQTLLQVENDKMGM